MKNVKTNQKQFTQFNGRTGFYKQNRGGFYTQKFHNSHLFALSGGRSYIF